MLWRSTGRCSLQTERDGSDRLARRRLFQAWRWGFLTRRERTSGCWSPSQTDFQFVSLRHRCFGAGAPAFAPEPHRHGIASQRIASQRIAAPFLLMEMLGLWSHVRGRSTNEVFMQCNGVHMQEHTVAARALGRHVQSMCPRWVKA